VGWASKLFLPGNDAMLLAISTAFFPLRRRRAIAPLPAGVQRAIIESSSLWEKIIELTV
jgi:hypothetical protein